MPSPPDDDDPVADWQDAAATTIDLSPDDLREIEREETTPTVNLAEMPGYEVGRRAGIYEVLGHVRALFGAAKNTPEFIETLALLLARRAAVPWPPETTPRGARAPRP